MPPGDRELLAANSAYYAAFEARDAAAMDEIWADGPDALCVHPGWDICAGATQVRTSYHRIFAGGQRLQVRLALVHVDVHGDIGRVTCVEHVSVPELDEEIGRVACTNLFRREGARWRMILHHASPISEDTDAPEDDGEFH